MRSKSASLFTCTDFTSQKFSPFLYVRCTAAICPVSSVLQASTSDFGLFPIRTWLKLDVMYLIYASFDIPSFAKMSFISSKCSLLCFMVLSMFALMDVASSGTSKYCLISFSAPLGILPMLVYSCSIFTLFLLCFAIIFLSICDFSAQRYIKKNSRQNSLFAKMFIKVLQKCYKNI